MGFENRRSIRIRTNIRVCFWPAGQADGEAAWGQVINLSETGLALSSPLPLPGDGRPLVEFCVDGRRRPLQVAAQVVHVDPDPSAPAHWVLRLRFVDLEGEERLLLRRFIFQVADPKLAAQTGWGAAYFTAGSGLETKYRGLSPAEHQQGLEDHRYLKIKEIVFLRKFQDLLERSLGSRAPENFRLLGSRLLQEGAFAWLELNLPQGHLHLLASVLWGRQEDEEKAELGLRVTAVQRDEAVKVERA